MTTPDPEQPGQRLRRASDRGPGGQPGPGDRLLHRGAAVLYRRGRPVRLRRDPEQPGRRLLELPTGDRAANLARAIGCYTEALRFYTAEATPLDYAMTQNNLGTAYAELPSGDRAANLARAIDCYTEALRFCTAEAAPAGAASRPAASVMSISNRAGGRRHTPPSPRPSAPASSSTRPPAPKPAGRPSSEAAGDAVAADAYCLARLGQLAEAVQRLEAGRARALGEALARDRAALQEASEADRAAFVAAADRIKALEAEGRRGQDTEAPAMEGRSFAERSAELVRAREDLAGVIQRIRVVPARVHGRGA